MGSVRQAVLCTATPPDLQLDLRYHHGCADVVKEKIGEIKDLGALDRDGLAAAVKEYYDLSCATFSERFDIEDQVKKNDMEIHALEMEVNDMHGKFIIPKLKKVHSFQLTSGEE